MVSEPGVGRAGWIAVLTLWVRAVVWMWILKGIGIMLPTIQEQFDSTTWVMGWISSLFIVVSGFIGNYHLT